MFGLTVLAVSQPRGPEVLFSRAIPQEVTKIIARLQRKYIFLSLFLLCFQIVDVAGVASYLSK